MIKILISSMVILFTTSCQSERSDSDENTEPIDNQYDDYMIVQGCMEDVAVFITDDGTEIHVSSDVFSINELKVDKCYKVTTEGIMESFPAKAFLKSYEEIK